MVAFQILGSSAVSFIIKCAIFLTYFTDLLFHKELKSEPEPKYERQEICTAVLGHIIIGMP